MTTFVINETQTHYYIKGDSEERYTQCLTCKNLQVEYRPDAKFGCTEKRVPRLPACAYRIDAGLTVRKL